MPRARNSPPGWKCWWGASTIPRARMLGVHALACPARCTLKGGHQTGVGPLRRWRCWWTTRRAIYPVRIDPTFSDADWFSLGGIPGADSIVYASVVDGSGNLFIGGDFTIVGEAVANPVAQWDGGAWSALGSGVDGSVLALAGSG